MELMPEAEVLTLLAFLMISVSNKASSSEFSKNHENNQDLVKREEYEN